MPIEFTQNLIRDVYKDDYKDSDGYYQVLFNSGRALQARELTQLQTILQEQVSRMGRNLFTDGEAVNPRSAGTGIERFNYVILENLDGIENPKDLIGTVLQGPTIAGVTQGLRFKVASVVEGDGANEFPVIYGRYTSFNQQSASDTTDISESQLAYLAGNTLTDIRGNFPNLTVRTPLPAEREITGIGLLFLSQSADIFVGGRFVFAEPQSIVISKYSDTANTTVGFLIQQDVVTALDDDALYDNQGARPNRSAPGADRYRIKLVLSTRDQVSDGEQFVTFAVVQNGEIRQIQDGTEGYNEIEQRMANRHTSTHGDFIVNPFNIRYFPGADSSELRLKVFGTQNGITPSAFVDGHLLEIGPDEEIIINKPKSFVTRENISTNAIYGNYISFKYDSLGGYTRFGDSKNLTGTTSPEHNIHTLFDSADAPIGEARVRAIRDMLDADEGLRAYLYAINMKDGKNFRNVRSVARKGDGAANGFVPTLEDGLNLFINDASNNNALFNIPGSRTKSVSDVEFTVQRQYNGTSTGGGTIQISCAGTGEAFDDTAQWFAIRDRINPLASVFVDINPGDVSIVGTSATISNLPTSSDLTIYAYVRKTDPTLTIKQYRKGWFTGTLTTDSDGTFFTFSSGDAYDGVELLECFAGKDSVDSASSSVLQNVIFDNGQRDNAYNKFRIQPNNIPASFNQCLARVAYLEWTTVGDYISVNSYDISANDSFGYAEIPTYEDGEGEVTRLNNVLDFRSRVDRNTNNGDFIALPNDGDLITFDAEFYNGRVDTINLSYDTQFNPVIEINAGEESQQPRSPGGRENSMLLFTARYGGNTLNVDDISIERHRYKRFRMSDIATLEARIQNLEDTVSLSFLEQDTQQTVVLDGNGEVRSKTGFFVETFREGIALTSGETSVNAEVDPSRITSAIDPAAGLLYPRLKTENVSFIFDSDNIIGPANLANNGADINRSNVIRKGDTLYLDYRTVLDSSLEQPLISWFSDGTDYEEHGYYNVNPYNVFQGEGFVKLSPASDVWTENRRLPDNIINGGIQVERRLAPTLDGNARWWQWGWTGNDLPDNIDPDTVREGQTVAQDASSSTTRVVGSFNRGTRRRWFRRGTRTTTTSRIVTDTVTDIETVDQVIADRVVQTFALPWIRQRYVTIKAEGLRPYTRYWPFLDGILVEQWCKRIVDEDAYDSEVVTYGGNNWGDVDVTLTQHPRRNSSDDEDAVFISDDEGKLFISLWIPNSAPVPNGDTFSSRAAWRAWRDAEQLEARALSNTKSAEIYNRIGWKFRAGSIEFKLLDISADDESSALSKARAIYTAQGRMTLRQADVLTTRVITVEGGGTETIRQTTRWWDPLAQTFMISAEKGTPGNFVTGVDVFLRSWPSVNDPQIPIQLQIRGVRDGTPRSGAISSQHRVYKSAADVRAALKVNDATDVSTIDFENIDEVLANPVHFEFDEPIYLQAGKEYALVLLAETDAYEAFVATTYGLVLGKTDERVSRQPTMGSLFLSQNGSTWTPKQNQDLAYRIYTAKFKQSGHANFYNEAIPRFAHNEPTTLTATDSSSTVRVRHLAHGLGVGDTITLRGLDSAATYGGVAGSAIMNSSNVVDSADALGYTFQLAGGETFNEDVIFGSDSVTSQYAFNFDRFVPNFTIADFRGTTVNMDARFISGYSYAQVAQTEGAGDIRFNIDDEFFPIQNTKTQFMDAPRYWANPQQENAQLDPNVKSIIVRADLSTNQSSGFGGPKAASISSSGYVADVSPIIDLQRNNAILVNYLIDNQVDSDGASPNTTTNKPTNFVDETSPLSGTSMSKQITKVVNMSDQANGLRITIEAYKPPAASFDVYYRTAPDPEVDMYSLPWVEIEPDAIQGDNLVQISEDQELNYNEWVYTPGGVDGDLPGFTSFQLKIVLKTTNTSQTPIIDNIRAIALV